MNNSPYAGSGENDAGVTPDSQTEFTPSTTDKAGRKGLVPPPPKNLATPESKVLAANGKWVDLPSSSSSAAEYMFSNSVTKLNSTPNTIVSTTWQYVSFGAATNSGAITLTHADSRNIEVTDTGVYKVYCNLTFKFESTAYGNQSANEAGAGEPELTLQLTDNNAGSALLSTKTMHMIRYGLMTGTGGQYGNIQLEGMVNLTTGETYSFQVYSHSSTEDFIEVVGASSNMYVLKIA